MPTHAGVIIEKLPEEEVKEAEISEVYSFIFSLYSLYDAKVSELTSSLGAHCVLTDGSRAFRR